MSGAVLVGQLLGLLATAGKTAKPHVVPIRYHFDPEQEVIEIGGRSLEARGQERLYVRHIKVNPQAALVVDDVPDPQTWQPRGISHQGDDGSAHGRWRGAGAGVRCGLGVEIVPDFVTSWGIDTHAL
ncbi:PNPOx family protein [Streptomyces massasporeus]|uniref:pyridoxamine 5'-phosphate oxidase family protein n=1 Tax=Streptomyces massasporeus TaxID=67324 RepID=UPI0036820DE0